MIVFDNPDCAVSYSTDYITLIHICDMKLARVALRSRDRGRVFIDSVDRLIYDSHGEFSIIL